MSATLATTHTNLGTGWENEFVVTGPNGMPVDLRPLFHRPRCRDGFSQLVLDAGRDQVEVTTNPSRSLGDHMAEMRHRYQAIQSMKIAAEGSMRGLPANLQMHFDPRRQCGTAANVGDFYKPRLKAMLKALQRPEEAGQRGIGVVQSGNINAFHVHFGLPDVFCDEAVTAMNLLNAAVPAITNWVHCEFGIKPAGRNQVWSFSRQDRQPAPRWFPDFQTFHGFFESIPRLVRPVGDSGDKHTGEWAPDLVTKQTLGDEAAEGTMWWAVRIRPLHRTVEYRPTPTLREPEQAALFVMHVDAWLERAMQAVGNRQFADFDEAMRSGVIPAFMDVPMPANETEWRTSWSCY